MRQEHVQVSVHHVARGMYVCGLDRPWLSTPFPFQGFVVRSDRDIEQLKAHCNYVYVDTARGVRPDISYTETAGFLNRDLERTHIRAARIKVRPDFYAPPKKLNREIKRARAVHDQLTRAVCDVIADLRVGRPVDIMAARRAAGDMIRSVIRHPDAFVWLIRLKDADEYAHSHSVRSAVLAIVLGRHLGLPEDELEDLALGVLLCDVGKARLPQGLLRKVDPLDVEELQQVQSHVDHSVDILQEIGGLSERIVSIVESHHERFDGSGYPYGLEGDRIPLFGRIAGLVDTYDAMTSARPHTRERRTAAEAMDYLYQHRDILFQKQLVEEFIKAIGIYPTGSVVELTSGEIGIIEAQNPNERLHPEVLIVHGADGTPVTRFRSINLTEHNQRHPDRRIDIERAVDPDDHSLEVQQILAQRAAQREGGLLSRLRLAS